MVVRINVVIIFGVEKVVILLVGKEIRIMIVEVWS